MTVGNDPGYAAAQHQARLAGAGLGAEPGSHLAVDPAWRPALPAIRDRFTLAGLLVFSESERNLTS